MQDGKPLSSRPAIAVLATFDRPPCSTVISFAQLRQIFLVIAEYCSCVGLLYVCVCVRVCMRVTGDRLFKKKKNEVGGKCRVPPLMMCEPRPVVVNWRSY